MIPDKVHTTENTAENMVTDLKLLYILMAESAGNIMSADTKSEPTRFMASTIITAITMAVTKLRILTFVPTALAKFSSKVIAKI